jgi:hypothetical protein
MWANSFLHFAGQHSECPAQSKCHDAEYQPKVTLDRSKFELFATVLGSVVDLSGRMENLRKAKDSHCESLFKTYQANRNKRMAYDPGLRDVRKGAIFMHGVDSKQDDVRDV